MVYYDHFITFDDEYKFIWRHWRSRASWLFFLNRYFAFFTVCLQITISPKKC